MSEFRILTREESLRSLEAAKAARSARADLKMMMKAGKVSFADALNDERAQRMYVRQFLASVPGIGPKKAEKIMAALHIAQNRRVSGLGSRQRERLVSLSASDWNPALY